MLSSDEVRPAHEDSGIVEHSFILVILNDVKYLPEKVNVPKHHSPSSSVRAEDNNMKGNL